MSDGKVGVRQDGSPDRQIDNEVVVNGSGDTVYRQRVKTYQDNPDDNRSLVNQGAGGAQAWKVDGSAVTQPVTGNVGVTSSALPTGAASEAGLGTDGASPPALAGTGIRGWLRAIYEKLTGTVNVSTGLNPLTDAQLRASRVPVDGSGVTQPVSDVTEGTTADAAVITDTTGTVSGKLRGLVKWAFERMPASLGQKTMANSFPVAVASDQSLDVNMTNIANVNVNNTPSVNVTQAITLNTQVSGLTGVVDTGNSVTGSIAAGAYLTGAFFDVKDYGASDIIIDTTGVATGPFTAYLDWSDNGVTTRVSEKLTWTTTPGGAPQIISAPTMGRWIRIRVNNGTGGAVTITTYVLHRPPKISEFSSRYGTGEEVRSSFVDVASMPITTGTSLTDAQVETSQGYLAAGAGASTWAGAVTELVFPFVFNGTTWDRLRGGTDGLLVKGPKAEDAASATGDTGFPILAVRRDTPAAETGSDGDYTIPTADSTGAQRVTGRYAEDAASAGGEYGFAQLLVRRDTPAAETSADGDFTQPTADSVGAQYVHQRNGVIEGRTVKVANMDSDITNGNKQLIAAVASKKLRVLSYSVSQAGGANTNKFTDASGGAVLCTAALPATASQVEAAPPGTFLFETTAGNALFLNTNTAQPRSVRITYIEV